MADTALYFVPPGLAFSQLSRVENFSLLNRLIESPTNEATF
jgi:hypothetical protein